MHDLGVVSMKHAILVSVCVGSWLYAGVGLAQSVSAADCSCVVSSNQSGALVGSTGTVSVSGSAGFAQAADGTPLPVGTVVRTGADGAASIVFGSACRISLTQSQRLTVSSLQASPGNLCVGVENIRVVAQSSTVGNPWTLVGVGAAIGGGAALSNDRDNKSQ